MKKYAKFIYVFIPLLLASLEAYVLKDSFDSLNELTRSIVLPSSVFMIVWSILYVLMGIWSYLYENDFGSNKVISIYWLSIFINLMFTPLLFLKHWYLIAFIDSFILLIMIVYLFIDTLRKSKKYAYLLLPYIMWLIVANTLMIDILYHN